MNTENHILDLIIAQVSGNISPEESIELNNWKISNNANLKKYEELLRLTLRSEFSMKWDSLDIISAKKKHSHYAKKKNKVFSLYTKLAAAAAITLLLLAGGTLMYQNIYKMKINQFSHIIPGEAKAVLTLSDGSNINIGDSALNIIDVNSGVKIIDNKKGSIKYNAPAISGVIKTHYNILNVKRGGEYQLTLSDGTKVWFNSESKLKYPVVFTGGTREVYLKGEAYFEVAHNKEKVFIVRTKKSNIKVLGTSFNVKVYENEESQITLVSGKVNIQVGEEAYVLTPGKQAVINNSTNEIAIKEVDVDRYISWKDGVFKFVNLPMEKLAVELSRWYDVEFAFADEQLKNEKFSGAITKYRSLDYILDLIEKTNDLNFEYDYDKIIIKQR
jgi:ferric-dicitrate binding protein FerR (iron transport regulator)